MTHTIPLTEFKVRLSRLMDDIADNDDEIIITRNGKPVAVLMNPDEYESWKETQAITQDPEAMQEIKDNLIAIQKGKAKKYTFEELFGPIK